MNGVISEVDIFVFQIFQSKLLARSTQISIFVPIAFDDTIDRCNQNVATNIKFTLVIEKRVLKVFLNDKSSAVFTFLADQGSYFLEVV